MGQDAGNFDEREIGSKTEVTARHLPKAAAAATAGVGGRFGRREQSCWAVWAAGRGVMFSGRFDGGGWGVDRRVLLLCLWVAPV